MHIITTLKSIKADLHSQALMRRWGLTELSSRIAEILGCEVRSGPFAGLVLPQRSCGSVWLPKLLGSYECELHEVVLEIIRLQPDLVIDLGCAEGFYALGFAMKLPGKKVLGADTNPLARMKVRRQARHNRLTNVGTLGFVAPAKLDCLLKHSNRPVLWLDIEGGEDAILHPENSDHLCRTFIVVENHEHITGVSSDTLMHRFATTHNCEVIKQTKREAANFLPEALKEALNEREIRLCVDEFRVESQEWMVFRPRDY